MELFISALDLCLLENIDTPLAWLRLSIEFEWTLVTSFQTYSLEEKKKFQKSSAGKVFLSFPKNECYISPVLQETVNGRLEYEAPPDLKSPGESNEI